MLTRSVFAFACLMAGVTGASADNHATYELRRINVGDGWSFQSRCHFSPGEVRHITSVNGIDAETITVLNSDDQKIQGLVDAACGVEEPDFSKLNKNFTNWWVRSSPTAPWKLIRSNTGDNPGGSLLQDESDAGKTLATFMGINCPRTFGQ